MPKLPMLIACNHYRYHGANAKPTSYGCALFGECKPIQAGPDISSCREFAANGLKPEPATGAVTGVPAAAGVCIHLGKPTGKLVECQTCQGRVQLKTFECGVYGECTIGKKAGTTAVCAGCPSKKVT